MALMVAKLGVLALAATQVWGAEQQVIAQGQMNPIRKVVTLLQSMQKKVTEEGESEKELFDKFMCYCTNGKGDLEKSIADADAKVPAVGSEITVGEEKLEQAKGDLTGAQTDRAAAKEAMAQATGIREKEAAAFGAAKAEDDINIAAIAKAVAALEKGSAGSFLQTETAQVIRNLANNDKVDMTESDRQDLVAFLSQGSGYAPQSGQITGILKEMGDTMTKELAEDTATEAASIKTFSELIAAKEKEVQALTATVETKTTQIGELGVAIVQMKEDLSDTAATLMEDKKFLAELESSCGAPSPDKKLRSKTRAEELVALADTINRRDPDGGHEVPAELESSCGTKTKEWEERSKTRAEEFVALADTIKVLNDDEAMDLFKNTLPGASASLVQVRVSASAERSQALSLIRAIHQKADKHLRPALDLIALVLSGKKAMNQGTFVKVIKMCDDMVVILKKEQLDDDNKKEYCSMQFDTTDDSKKALERKVADAESAIANAKEGIETTTQEIAALEVGIKELDKSVAEATEQRQAENVEYKELMASDSAATELLGFAKNRLNKFYNPKLFKAAPKQEFSEEERVFVNNGGTPPPTEAPGGIADTGVAVLAQVRMHNQLNTAAAPAPPPDTWGAYQKKDENSNGVISMIDLLIKDLEKEMTEAKTGENEAESDYQAMMGEAAAKRTTDSKSLTEKAGAKADLEADLQAHSGDHKATVNELMATEKYIASLHAECDWLLQYFETRKAARADEIDSLGRAKAVLSGADYSLLQTRARGFLRRKQ
eukprot:CAMPEP_0204246786 /NCGR_PEP_ID=MMETSP0361-20130328/98319_1 /ASSEMBLY_ACC=CAM_ASM_000343 /TAXON_ID=268821 /ORGANISM="Scrippsiella Hangoei, Strain SHTV-5" /LENGTH=775 /DNA_ID=CAMNT_0051220013 /DNA_START=32 /DNA_END=2360 /DNA_ORIENTATION=+